MASGLRSVVALAGSAVLLPALVSVACHDATQVELEITTDLKCGDHPATGIYGGPGKSLAQTTDCTERPGSDAEVGTLTLAPSGDRDGRTRVRVVLARGRKPEECDARPEDCVVASRSFSFVEHRALHLPIRLTAECLGKRCAEGETCAAGGVCVPDAVTCAGGECRSPAVDSVVAAAPGVPDASVVEAGTDAAPPPECTSRDPAFPDVVVRTTTLVTHSAFAQGTFYFSGLGSNVDPATGKKEPAIVSVSSNGLTGAIEREGDFGIMGITTSNGGWAAAVDRAVAPNESIALELPGATPAIPIAQRTVDDNTPLEPVNAMVGGAIKGEPVVFLARGTKVDVVPLPSGPLSTFALGGGTGIAVDATTLYLATANGIVSTVLGTGKTAELSVLAGAVPIVFGTDGTTVFAFGTSPLSGRAIFALNGTTLGAALLDPGPTVVSLTADADHVYWTDGSVVRRAARAGIAAPVPEIVYPESNTKPAPGSLDHLVVHGPCLYFWASNGTGSELRVRKKSP